MISGVYGSRVLVRHVLEWPQDLEKRFLVFVVSGGDLNIIPPDNINYFILLSPFKMSFTQIGRDGINNSKFWSGIHQLLLTGDLLVHYGG